MKYRGFYIDETETTDVLRPTETGSERCNGIWFRLYADADYGIQIDDFIGAYGQDDRVCAFTALESIFDTDAPELRQEFNSEHRHQAVADCFHEWLY